MYKILFIKTISKLSVLFSALNKSNTHGTPATTTSISITIHNTCLTCAPVVEQFSRESHHPSTTQTAHCTTLSSGPLILSRQSHKLLIVCLCCGMYLWHPGSKVNFFFGSQLNNKWHSTDGVDRRHLNSAIHPPATLLFAFAFAFPGFRLSSLIGVEWSLPCGRLSGWKVVAIKDAVYLFFSPRLRVALFVLPFAKSSGRAWNLLT